MEIMALTHRLTLAVLVLTVSGFCVKGDINQLKLHELFFNSVNFTLYLPCIRLTNSTHQIGCSASNSHVRGVLYHVAELRDIDRLNQNPHHAPYIVLLEEHLFTGDADAVRSLTMAPTVKGIVVRYDENFTMEAGRTYFSPVKKCPNEGYGEESSGCGENSYWNEIGTNLLYNDFGDFPIFVMDATMFDEAVECYNQYNNGSNGGYKDFPLCSMELVADMKAAVDTPTCIRRGNLPIPYLNGESFCDPLGDLSVWGSLFNLSVENFSSSKVIMLATKLDSISFFPTALAYGASGEVAAIATLLAVIEQFGMLKRNWNVTLTRPILYSFFHGESWDYIGSSRMAYDMDHQAFPENKNLPRISLSNISHFLELSQLGLISNRTIYVHGDKTSNLVSRLTEAAQSSNLEVRQSSREDLPPTSLQRFIREGKMTGAQTFSASGSVLTSFDNTFVNRFFGSRYDDINNFGNRTLDEVATDLAAVATAVAKAVFNISEPSCNETSCEEVSNTINASSETVSEILGCFLSHSNCNLFRSVLIRNSAKALPPLPVSRYVTVNSQSNIETVLTKQLVALYSANNASELNNPVKCSDCFKRMKSHDRDKTVNITWMQHNSSAESDDKLCLCIESFTYTHTATSPVFKYKEIPYDSNQYSTWTESRWTGTSVRFYLVTYPLQEVGFLFLGLFITALTLLFSVQCTRKGTAIFAVSSSQR